MSEGEIVVYAAADKRDTEFDRQRRQAAVASVDAEDLAAIDALAQHQKELQ